MGPEVLPTFRLQTISESGLVGRFEPSLWAEERAVAGLYLGGGRFLWGRFCRVDQSEATCEFEPDDPTELLALRIGESYPYVGGYYGERAELVLDSTRIWHLSVFRPRDSVRFEGTAGIMETRASGDNPDGGMTVPGGWDHEHCFICQAKIGTGGQTVGYVDQSSEWVCEYRYRNFVEPHSIDFVTWIGGISASPPVPDSALDQRNG